MCTRYYVEMSPELMPYIEAADQAPLRQKMADRLGKNFKGTGEIRPTDMAAVIAPSVSGRRTAFPMIWGYHIPGMARPIVNARVETAKEKPTFAADWKRHRCIIPASYYFEWEHIKEPDGKIKTGGKYAIRPRGDTVTFLAGLYRLEEKRGFRYPVFTVLTREPDPALAKIHDRMPVILPEEAIDDWIRPDGDPEKIAGAALTDMIAEKTPLPAS